MCVCISACNNGRQGGARLLADREGCVHRCCGGRARKRGWSGGWQPAALCRGGGGVKVVTQWACVAAVPGLLHVGCCINMTCVVPTNSYTHTHIHAHTHTRTYTHTHTRAATPDCWPSRCAAAIAARTRRTPPSCCSSALLPRGRRRQGKADSTSGPLSRAVGTPAARQASCKGATQG